MRDGMHRNSGEDIHNHLVGGIYLPLVGVDLPLVGNIPIHING